MDITIRPARESDFPAISAIYDQAVREGLMTFELVPPDVGEMVRRWRRLADGGYPWLVAAVGDDVLGYAYFGPYKDRPAYRWTVEDTIYVAPGAHRRGIGRALLSRLVEIAEAGGFRQMIAVIGDTDNAGSIGVHRAAGFEMTGTLRSVGHKFGRWVDVVIMQRQLGAGDGTQPEDSVRPRPAAGDAPEP